LLANLITKCHFLLISEVDIKPGDPPILTYTVSGGILDLYIFTGPSPIEVNTHYIRFYY